ncbi:hypothetical protein TNCV_2106491 [Trichonephila clavipes]|nr:hypothetical protein TNCV_1327431 [Trichonephila clavipes]GFU70310.1 hypothetical protein TNCV_2106491 [Trichonephila clavipes]
MRTNGETSLFQMDPGSVYSIKMVTSMFGGNMPCETLRFSRIFLEPENVRLLPWPAHSPDLSPIGNVWSMVVERLARHHMLVTTVDELCVRVEATWISVPVYAIQPLCDSIPRRIRDAITARVGCSGY